MFTIKLKSGAYRVSLLLVQGDRVLSEIICDNMNEMLQGKLNRTLKKASYNLRQTKQFTTLVKCRRKRDKRTEEIFWKMFNQKQPRDFGMIS